MAKGMKASQGSKAMKVIKAAPTKGSTEGLEAAIKELVQVQRKHQDQLDNILVVIRSMLDLHTSSMRTQNIQLERMFMANQNAVQNLTDALRGSMVVSAQALRDAQQAVGRTGADS